MFISGTTKFYRWLGLALALLLASLLAGCGSSPATTVPVTNSAIAEPTTAATSQRIAVGAPAPDFTRQTVDDQPLQISALKGKALIINYWAVY